jgi:hypothetical protein
VYEDGGILADSGKADETLAISQQSVQQKAKGVILRSRQVDGER